MATDPMIKSPATHLYGIHALRGIAALMVFLFHLHYVGNIPIPKSWGLIASHGGTGVQLFFALSAFSLLYSNQKHADSQKSNWMFSYIIKRFFRIAPLFYFMLIVHSFVIVLIYKSQLDLSRTLINMFFIFNFAPSEATGIVWASWSIGVEMVFYALLPLIMVSVRSLKSATFFWIVAVIASYCYRVVLENNPNIDQGYSHYAFMSQLGVFAGGILSFWFYAKLKATNNLKNNFLFWLAVLLGPILAIFLFSKTSTFLSAHHRADVQLWGVAYGMIAMLSALTNTSWMKNKILQFFGERSYSIYLIHTLVIAAMAALLRDIYDYCYPIIGGYAFALCAITVLLPTLLLSELTYRLIELKGIQLGRIFYKK